MNPSRCSYRSPNDTYPSPVKLAVRKKDWAPGTYQVLIYVRSPDGSEMSTSWDRLPDVVGKKVLELVSEICSKKSVRTLWERLLSICSAHIDPDPNCKLCQATPHDLFPDWDDATAEAEIAGTMKCKHCGFDFYRTTLTCPACNKKATELNLAEAMVQAEDAIDARYIVKDPNAIRIIESLYFHMRMALGRMRRLQGKGEDGKASPG